MLLLPHFEPCPFIVPLNRQVTIIYSTVGSGSSFLTVGAAQGDPDIRRNSMCQVSLAGDGRVWRLLLHNLLHNFAHNSHSPPRVHSTYWEVWVLAVLGVE